MNNRLIRQRGLFFGMALILAVLATILVWQFVSSDLLALASICGYPPNGIATSIITTATAVSSKPVFHGLA